jgi:hypothetical protein
MEAEEQVAASLPGAALKTPPTGVRDGVARWAETKSGGNPQRTGLPASLQKLKKEKIDRPLFAMVYYRAHSTIPQTFKTWPTSVPS